MTQEKCQEGHYELSLFFLNLVLRFLTLDEEVQGTGSAVQFFVRKSAGRHDSSGRKFAGSHYLLFVRKSAGRHNT